MARSIVTLDGSVAGATTAGGTLASSGHPPAVSQRSATARASTQSNLPVLRFRRTLAREPAAMMGQPHRFQVFAFSWNSPVVDHRGRPAVHSPWWRRYRLRGMIWPQFTTDRITTAHHNRLSSVYF